MYTTQSTVIFLITITLYSCNLQRWDDVFVASCSWAGKASSCEAPCLVEFKNESEGLITEVHWDFGDGSPIYVTKDTLESPKHIYTKPQTYPASIKIFGVDDQGESRSAICTMDVVVGEWQCGDPLLDVRDSTYYGTIPMGNQCWMAENLNYGSFITSRTAVGDNMTPEKYCLNDNPLNCDRLGGLYPWNELMNYVADPNDHDMGLCPTGWKVPSLQDFRVLARNQMTSEEIEMFDNNPNLMVWSSCGLMALRDLSICSLANCPGGECGSSGFNFLESGRIANLLSPTFTPSNAFFHTSTRNYSDPDQKDLAWGIILSGSNSSMQYTSLAVTKTAQSCRCIRN